MHNFVASIDDLQSLRWSLAPGGGAKPSVSSCYCNVARFDCRLQPYGTFLSNECKPGQCGVPEQMWVVLFPRFTPWAAC